MKLVVAFVKKPSEAVPTLIKAIAEGKLGEQPKKIYWALAGKKTWITVAVVGVATTLESIPAEQCVQCADWTAWAWSAAGFLLVAGLWDGAVRAVPPKKKK
jgi:hypothetical protein